MTVSERTSAALQGFKGPRRLLRGIRVPHSGQADDSSRDWKGCIAVEVKGRCDKGLLEWGTLSRCHLNTLLCLPCQCILDAIMNLFAAAPEVSTSVKPLTSRLDPTISWVAVHSEHRGYSRDESVSVERIPYHDLTERLTQRHRFLVA